MDTSGTSRPSRALLRTVAELHYQRDFSQVEIAKRLGMSTATISRVLKRARDIGIVRIEITEPREPDELAARLLDALGLERVAVCEAARESGVLTALAEPVGRLMSETGLGHGKVFAIGWGRTILQLLEVGLPRLPGTIVVPAIGGMPDPAPYFQVNEFVRQAAHQMNGVPRFIHAPYLPSDQSRESLLAEPAIGDTIQLWDHLDSAIVGIGVPYSGGRSHGWSSITPTDPAIAGAACDVLLRYFDRDGQPIEWKGQSRLLSISLDQLRRTPFVIGVAASTAKTASIVSAARSGVIDALVTDTTTAAAVLELLSLP